MFNNFHHSLKSLTEPLWIAGPCSAEDQEHLTELAIRLKISGAHILRAGAWKPRTRPGAFEGFGAPALKWIRAAGDASGLPVITEVASAKHVEQALASGIDMLWIGARTTVNPFLIQEIADELKGVDIPVFVKNPVNPDVKLWMGAIERFMQNGISRIASVHRGFSSFENSTYRNKPNWELAIELRRLLPHVPIICDPSHISGDAAMVPTLTQIAFDMQYDGVMVEVHLNPAKALSDAMQQITPEDFSHLRKQTIVRQPTAKDPVELSKLHDLRDLIDELDNEIIEKIAGRMEVVRKIGQYKDQNNMAILQLDRFKEILRTRTETGLHNQLTPDFILRLYSLIHEESILQQDKQMTKPELRASSKTEKH